MSINQAITIQTTSINAITPTTGALSVGDSQTDGVLNVGTGVRTATGVLNMATGASTACALNIMNGNTTAGSVNIANGTGASQTTTVNIGSGSTTGLVTIGNTANTTTVGSTTFNLVRPPTFTYTTVPTLTATQQGYLYNNVISGTTLGTSPFSISSFQPSNNGVYMISFNFVDSFSAGAATFNIKIYSGATSGSLTTAISDAYGYGTTTTNQANITGSTILTLSNTLFYSLGVNWSAGFVSTSYVGNFRAIRIA